jgi:hypothetical protein
VDADLEEGGSGGWQSATAPVQDAAIEEAQRWANIQDLQRRIDGVETDALYQEDLGQPAQTHGQRQKRWNHKLFNAMGSVGAARFQIQAEKDREEAARLRDELARIEN